MLVVPILNWIIHFLNKLEHVNVRHYNIPKGATSHKNLEVNSTYSFEWRTGQIVSNDTL